MKKLFLFIGALSLVACSNDPIEFNDINNPKIYAERVPGIVASLPDAWELDISGNVLNKIKINSSQEDTFNYLGGKLTEVNHFTNGVFVGVDEFTYDGSNNLQSITIKNSSDVITSTKVFDYSNPVLIEEVVTFFDAVGNVTGTYTLFKKIVNGNLVNYNFSEYQEDTYSYDNKENVFSNLTSLNELILYYSNDRVGKNNRTNSVSNFYFNGGLSHTSTITFLNQYDSSGKITESDVLFGGIQHYKVKFTY